MPRQSLTRVPGPSPASVSPQCKAGVKAGQPELEEAAARGAGPRAGHRRAGRSAAAILPPRARSSRPCRRPPSPIPSLVLRGNPPPHLQLGLLTQSPWEQDSSGLGTDAPSLAFSLPLAFGGGWALPPRPWCPSVQPLRPVPGVDSPIYSIPASLEPVSWGRGNTSLSTDWAHKALRSPRHELTASVSPLLSGVLLLSWAGRLAQRYLAGPAPPAGEADDMHMAPSKRWEDGGSLWALI